MENNLTWFRIGSNAHFELTDISYDYWLQCCQSEATTGQKLWLIKESLAWWSLEKTFLTSSFRHWICLAFSEFSAFFLTFSLTSWYPDDLKVVSSEINVWRDHKIDAIYSAFGVKKTYYQSEPSHYEKFSFLLVKILNSKKCLCIQKNFGIKIIKIKLINICAIITVIITDLWLEAYSEWSLFDSSCYIDHIIWWTYIMLHTHRKSIMILS